MAGYPNIERVLTEYVNQKLASGEDFYLSPEVNSDVMRPVPGFGLAFLASIAALAAKIAPAVVKGAEVVGTVAAISGTGKKGEQLSSQDIANAITPQVVANMQAQGVTLPPAVASQVTVAGLTDIFGSNTKPILIAAGIGLVALLLFKRR